MEKNKQPGITFDRIIVKNVHFEREAIFNGEHKLDLRFEKKAEIKESNKLIFLLRGIVEDHSKNFKFEATLLGYFSAIGENPNMPLDVFAETIAPAHILPFFRELVFNITSRAGIPPIILPPMNVNAMIKDSKKKKK